MTSELASKMEAVLANLQKSQLPASAKSGLLLDVIERTLPMDHFLFRDVRDLATFHPGSGPTEAQVTQLIEKVLLVLPLYQASAGGDLSQQIDNAVRVALNEKFSSSLLFRISALLLVVAATMFSFGLFRLYDKVSRADEIVQQFDKQLALSGILISTKEAALNERLAQAQTKLENEVENARKTAINAQRDAMTSLNTTLQSKIDQVERARGDSLKEIEKAVAAVEGSKNKAVSAIESHFKDKAVPDINAAIEKGVNAVNQEQHTQRGLLVERAKEIIRELKEPSLRNVLGRTFWLMVVSFTLSLVSIVVVGWAWWKSTAGRRGY